MVLEDIETLGIHEELAGEEVPSKDNDGHYQFGDEVVYAHFLGKAFLWAFERTATPYYRQLATNYISPKISTTDLKLEHILYISSKSSIFAAIF